MEEFDFLDVLVVDDSPMIVKRLRVMLETLGYRVVRTAANGNDAVAAYRAVKPDVVTMDITMPGMDGIEAARAIIKEFPDARIIMVTSLGQEKMILEALKAGAKGFLLKPFQQHKIHEAIQNACKRVVLKDKLQSEIEQRRAQKEAAEKAAAPADSEVSAQGEAPAEVPPGEASGAA